MRNLILFSLITTVSCSGTSEQENSVGLSNFHLNGNIQFNKQYVSDSIYTITYYNEVDSGRVDSVYQFELFNTNFIPTNQTIYSTEQINAELSISRTDSTIEFRLLNPRYDYIAANILRPFDSTFWGPNEVTEIRILSLPITELEIVGYIQDWGIYSESDSIGTIGRQVNRILPITIQEHTLQQML